MFKRLDEFLIRLRSKQFLKTIESDPRTAQSVFFFDRAPSEGYDYAYELIGFLKHCTIRDPSILDFQSATYAEKEGIRCVTLITSPKSMSREPIIKGFPQFVYIDEKWWIYIPKPV